MRIATLLVAVALVSSCRSAQPAAVASVAPSDQSVLSEQEGLMTMRRVLSAELSRPAGGAYESLADVLKTMRTLPVAVSAVDGDTATLKGYRLRITVSEDKRRFQASLTPEQGCGKSWFSSEQSVIYVGTLLDCAAN